MFNEMIHLLNEFHYSDWITVELDSYEKPKRGAEISHSFLSNFGIPVIAE